MKKLTEEGHENQERWLLTYADLITLLMIFFVVLYTMSNVDAQKYSALAQSLNETMGSSGGNIIDLGQYPDSLKSVEKPVTEKDTLENVKEELDRFLKENGLDSFVTTVLDDRGLVIRFKESIIFDSGKTNIKNEHRDKIIKIGDILKKTEGYIRVEGHTDNIPINNERFKSNWELSAIRATTVVELLIKESQIPANKISAIGFGENRPIADNGTVEGRAKNRRVEIIVVNSKFNKIEGFKN